VKDVHIFDIAHGLALTCRFSGQCLRFYSVAEHSVYVSKAVEKFGLDAARWGLLHDASEAYLTDVPSPIKPCLVGYSEIEERIQRVIAEKFDLPWPCPRQVKEADKAILRDEQEQVMLRSEHAWFLPERGLDVWIAAVGPEDARIRFANRWMELNGDVM